MQDNLKNVSLKFSCKEKWENMAPNAQGRHCTVCNKTVVDFTNKTQTEFDTAVEAAGGKLCGRFSAKQTTTPLYSFDRAAAAVLTTAGLSLLACNSNGQTLVGKVLPPTTRGEVEVVDTTKAPGCVKPPAVHTPTPKDSLIEYMMLGEPALDPVIEPQYPGGNDSLQSFIQRNMRWPEKLAGNATVYVQLEVDTLGKVSNAVIVSGYRPDVDAEALRIASLLQFTAPKLNGTLIKSAITIPIKFIKKS